RDQRLDNFAALDQQAMYRLVDAVDLLAQFRQCRRAAPRLGFTGFAHGYCCSLSGDVIAVARAERKENIDRRRPRSLALAPQATPRWLMCAMRVEVEAANRAEAIRREADDPHSKLVRFGPDKPLKLDAGVELSPFQIAYMTYGELNAQKTNAILI